MAALQSLRKSRSTLTKRSSSIATTTAVEKVDQSRGVENLWRSFHGSWRWASHACLPLKEQISSQCVHYNSVRRPTPTASRLALSPADSEDSLIRGSTMMSSALLNRWRHNVDPREFTHSSWLAAWPWTYTCGSPVTQLHPRRSPHCKSTSWLGHIARPTSAEKQNTAQNEKCALTSQHFITCPWQTKEAALSIATFLVTDPSEVW